MIQLAGERQNGIFIEQLYVAAAETIVISPRVTWGDDTRRLAAMADQLSLGQLATTGEQLHIDAAALLDRAAFNDEQIASSSASTEVRFANETERTAFLRDYIDPARRGQRRPLRSGTSGAPNHGGRMSADRFEAAFVVQTDPSTTWDRLTEHPDDSTDESQRLSLPPQKSSATTNWSSRRSADLTIEQQASGSERSRRRGAAAAHFRATPIEPK